VTGDRRIYYFSYPFFGFFALSRSVFQIIGWNKDITTTARYLHVDDNEVTIAASETLDALLNGEKRADDEQGVIDIRAARKNGA